jgi:hypothetical protein
MKRLFSFSFLLLVITLHAQVFNPDTVRTKPFDYGKMWTFDNPPIEYFARTYNFNPDAQWMDVVRMASLRLSSGCSGSFVSANGLLITNHHCAREDAVLSTRPEDKVAELGYYAPTRDKEIPLKDFYVDQLVRIQDITDAVKKAISGGSSESDALKGIRESYAGLEGWSGLTLQTLTFYSGGKYSLYGFKRFTDVRLVMIPETELGFFGGDPDNFTYPRHALDYAFMRVYENGQPVNSSKFFYPFNPNGIQENEPVFVVGNPGSTGRFRTMAQLQYDRDREVPIRLEFFRSRIRILSEYNKTLKSDSLMNEIFSISNAEKAFGGRLEGLHNAYYMTRKTKLEEQSKAQFLKKETTDYWKEVETLHKELANYTAEFRLLGFSDMHGKAMQLMHYLDAYGSWLGKDETKAEEMRQEVLKRNKRMDPKLEKQLLITLLEQLQRDTRQKPSALDTWLGGKSVTAKVDELFANSKILNGETKLPKTAKEFEASKDALIAMGKVLAPAYQLAAAKTADINAKARVLEQKIINANFTITGAQVPPDATFSLRISDGVVKGYKYNGTYALHQTSFHGMYDRFYSNGGKEPWSLPARWQNPSLELLRSPLNFVATFDTIGGNSGSPVINRNREFVGLNFDSNIDRLPIRNILYDPSFGRSVGVHAGGIAASLKHIYGAGELLGELGIK